jgi:hypothetical protein
MRLPIRSTDPLDQAFDPRQAQPLIADARGLISDRPGQPPRLLSRLATRSTSSGASTSPFRVAKTACRCCSTSALARWIAASFQAAISCSRL